MYERLEEILHLKIFELRLRWEAEEAPLKAQINSNMLAGGEGAIDRDGRGWVRTREELTVRYRAGLAADWAGLPPEIAHGAAIMGAHLFDNRDAAAVPPAAVAALWRPWRRMRLDTPRRA